MNVVIVRRGNQQAHYDVASFISLIRSGYFARTDLVFDRTSGVFLPAERFADIEPHLPPKSLGEIVAGAVEGLLSVGAVLSVGMGAIALLETLLDSPQPSRRPRRRVPNREPLESWKKAHVRDRDRRICTYCGRRSPRGHVDHKTSRANGGSNLLRNLTWACAPCNWSKGSLDAPQFRRRMTRIRS